MPTPSIPGAAGALMDAPVQTDYAFSLADLQLVALCRFGMSRPATLAAAVKLYERGLISYPRVEARLLPLNQFKEMARIVRDYRLVLGDPTVDPEWQGPVWVAEVPTEHTGITLTPLAAAAVFGLNLSDEESHIYGLVHERLLSLFKRPATGA